MEKRMKHFLVRSGKTNVAFCLHEWRNKNEATEVSLFKRKYLSSNVSMMVILECISFLIYVFFLRNLA